MGAVLSVFCLHCLHIQTIHIPNVHCIHINMHTSVYLTFGLMPEPLLQSFLKEQYGDICPFLFFSFRESNENLIPATSCSLCWLPGNLSHPR